ncbi:hypothetical protein [Microvirga terrestris]|uniref:Phasin family protein n=1 Tax=Microvirga terrestris TaxID=2791024 RepID=A0ABS0HWW1_9HYPH|nr:hypothetical protein [Microvirga terrestris]MBF9197776.1 hypothetical protein [Microvirga terrestris]
MALEQDQAEFAAALQEFEAIEANLPKQAPSLYERLATAMTLAFSANTKISLNDAEKGIIAAKNSLRALADITTDEGTLQRYVNAMRALTAELTAVINQKLASTSHVYAPLTAAFRASKDTLTQAYERAKKMANAINLATEVLNAFAKLVAVI